MTFFDLSYQNLVGLIRSRRDVRSFRSDPIPDHVLRQLLEVANLAPSVGLSQPWRFVIVSDASRRDRICQLFESENARRTDDQPEERRLAYARLKLAGLREAPTHLGVFAARDPNQGHGLGRASMPETVAYSVVMAVHTLWLASRALGIGLGWVSILPPAEVAAALDVPAEWQFIGYLCLGYPADESEMPELEKLGWEYRRPPRILER